MVISLFDEGDVVPLSHPVARTDTAMAEIAAARRRFETMDSVKIGLFMVCAGSGNVRMLDTKIHRKTGLKI